VRRLSFTSIDTYENCPAKWRFQYVDGLGRGSSPYLSFGSSIHEALEWFHKRPVPVAPSLDELLERFEEVWIPEGYASPDEEARWRDHGRDVLTRYHAENSDPFILPAGIEAPFTIEIEGVQVSGKIDRLDRLPGGGYEVIDYKTNRKLPPKAKVEKDLQLSIYHLAARELWDIDPERLTMYYVLPGHRISTSRTPAQLDDVRRRIATVAERIEAGRFDPSPNPLCGWCAFQTICPAYRYREDRRAGATDAEAGRDLEEWVRLHGERAAIDKRLAEVGDRLLLFAKEHDYRRLGTAEGVGAERRRREVAVDPAKVREVLAPLGRLDEVLTVDLALVARLLERHDLPSEVEDALLGDPDLAPDELRFVRMPADPAAEAVPIEALSPEAVAAADAAAEDA
jgi:putative RecB family exonuclease